MSPMKLAIADDVLPPCACAVSLAYSLSLPTHRGTLEERLAPPFVWERKARMHSNFFTHVGTHCRDWC